MPDNDDLFWLAKNSGLSAPVANRIRAGDVGVDTKAMQDANFNSLMEDAHSTSVPTVYDSVNHAVVDTNNPDWLNLLGSGRCMAS